MESTRPVMRLLTHWHKPWGVRRIIGLLVIALGMVLCTWLVFETGGIRFVFSHSMYVPILLAGAIFGTPGGIIGGLIAGVALGPYMPIDTTTGEMQELVNWLYRAGFFALIGGITGGLVTTAVTLAGRDPVSGLPGPVALHRTTARLFDHHKAGQQPRVYVLALNNLAEVAGMFGVETGASLVRELVDWIMATAGSRRVYQVQTNAFAVLIEDDPRDDLRDQLAEGMSKPVTANGIPIYVHLSLGVSQSSSEVSAEAAIRGAIEAAFAARVSTELPRVTERSAPAALRDNIDLLSGLGDAIDSQQLLLHYQPILDPAFQRVHGIEALVRWQHPTQGLLAPDRFLPQTEFTPLIQSVTAWVLDAALTDAETLQRDAKAWQCSVNLAAPNLYDPQLIDLVRRLLDDHAIPAERLALEIPTHALIDDPPHVSDTLGALRDIGVSLALDDFGQTHGNMQAISHIPVSTIKISRALMQELDQLSSRQHVVESIVVGAHRMGMTVVALGVEDDGVLQVARNLGCDLFQGFHFSHPLPADEIGAFRYPQPSSP